MLSPRSAGVFPPRKINHARTAGVLPPRQKISHLPQADVYSPLSIHGEVRYPCFGKHRQLILE